MGERVILVAQLDKKQAVMTTDSNQNNEKLYHKTDCYQILWNIIKFLVEITSNFRVILKSVARGKRVKNGYSSHVWNKDNTKQQFLALYCNKKSKTRNQQFTQIVKFVVQVFSNDKKTETRNAFV